MTHLQAPSSPCNSSAGGFWHKNNTVKVLELKTFQSRNKKKKVYPLFSLISLFTKSA